MSINTPMRDIESPVDLFEAAREIFRLRHLSYRTEQTYLGVIRKYLAFHDNRDPARMAAAGIRAYLAHMGVRRERRRFHPERRLQRAPLPLPGRAQASTG